jgi:light-regulated signal transduction histidine kinase (bacteriophytochrome)
MEAVQELTADAQQAPAMGIQRGAYLLELSLDWIVVRASENIHHLLRESHVTLIDEPLGKFVHAQALHDLRNLFSRLSGTMGIGRAYGIRLTDDPDLVDVAFHVSDGRVLFEAVPSAGAFGECFGSVGGLIFGLAGAQGDALLENAARRMRALTGYDRITLQCGEQRVESNRGALGGSSAWDVEVPAIVTDAEATVIALFPRDDADTAAGNALLGTCTGEALAKLKAREIRACLRIPFKGDGVEGEFRCESRTPREPSFELHAAAELFAQLFAMRLEIDRLKNGG